MTDPTEEKTVPVAMRLPAWNDLTNDQRLAVKEIADYIVGGTDAQFYAGQIALEIYTHVRENVTVDLPPLIAAAPDGLEAAEMAYLALLQCPLRHLRQRELCALRDFIAKATARSAEDVQNEYEERV